MEEGKLKAIVAKIVEVGPSRVVIDVSGEATTPRRALQDYGVTPDIIYVRNDTWSLGTPAQFDTVAQNAWRDEWVAVIWKDKPGDWWWRCWGSNEPPKEV